MQIETPGHERDAELAQLRAMVTELATRLAQLESDPRPAKHAKRMPDAARPPSLEALPTSRRGLLKRLGTSAAGAAVAATALGATRPERAAADAAATIVGASTAQYGVYAANSDITRPVLPAGVKTGVLGIASATANLTALASTQGSGVAGVTAGSTGVVGVSSEGGTGVGGICIAETPRALVNTVAGVAGVSTTRTGVSGISGSNHGVFGRSQAPAGTVPTSGIDPGAGMLAAGLAGRASSTVALYGYTDGPPNPSQAPVGAVGQCDHGFGVWGLSSAGPGATSRPGGGAVTAVSGVLGTSASGLGVYAISSGSYALAADGNGPTTVGALIRGLGGAQAAVFVGNVEINGHLTVTGGVNGPVSAAQTYGSGAAPAIANGDAVVEDFGEGRLVGGRGEVRLAAAFAALLQDEPYQVVLTEYDDHHALYVTGRTRQGFEVRAKDSPTASGTFSYRVVARPRTARATVDQAPTPLHVPTIPVPQGVPTLPVGRETPPAAPAPRPDAR
jgi:hypothetical protein